MNTYQPYTYLIGWRSLNLWYYGVRFSKNCHPSDLWVSYFTSSKYVAALREQHGEPDVVQVRKLFSSAASAQAWEERVLRRMNVLLDERWINRNIKGAYILTDDIRDIISRANKGKIVSKSTRLLVSNKLTGIKRSDETKAKTSIAARARPIITCPHCNKSGSSNTMKRWHFNNCSTLTGIAHTSSPCTPARRLAIQESRLATKKVACCHCGAIADPGNIAQHHNDNCKSKH
jgi:hypothetical protein